MNPQYYEDYFNRPPRSDAPDPVATAISGIFNLLEQVAEALEALEARVAALEVAPARAARGTDAMNDYDELTASELQAVYELHFQQRYPDESLRGGRLRLRLIPGRGRATAHETVAQ